MKILLAVDGSATSTRAARFAARLAREFADQATLELFYADPPLMRAVAVKLGSRTVHDYHADNATFAMKSARAVLTRAGIPFTTATTVARPAEAIVERAAAGRFDMIVMGSRSVLSGLLMGSVATKVMSRTDVPLTLVR
jgi:nucleotide-binding universal stress UspA family protein